MQLSMIDEKDHPELAPLIARIRAGRGGRYSYPFKLLLHNPAIAEAWLEQVTAVRWKITFDGAIREPRDHTYCDPVPRQLSRGCTRCGLRAKIGPYRTAGRRYRRLAQVCGI